jgi:hypothetical protein
VSFATVNAGVLTNVADVPAAETAASANCTEPGNAVVAAFTAIIGFVAVPVIAIGRVPVMAATPLPPPDTQALFARFRICKLVPLNHKVPACAGVGAVVALL